jgi:hypothetical protein
VNTQPLLRVRSIQVDKLFGLFDHRVDLKLDARVTILHGPNGVGKTMLLRMVSDLLAGRYALFEQVPFERFALEFTDGSRIEAISGKSSEDAEKQLPKPLRLSFFRDGRQQETYDVSACADMLSTPDARTNVAWKDLSNVVCLNHLPGHRSSTDRIAVLIDRLSPWCVGSGSAASDPKWLKDLRARSAVQLIAAQRLLKLDPNRSATLEDKPQNVHMVLDYADDLRVKIKDARVRYGQESDRLDQSFPQRLLMSLPAPLRADELKERMDKIDIEREGLNEIGLLERTAAIPVDRAALDGLDVTQQVVMTLYVQDTLKKLAVLSDLASRARIFLDNVNRNFLNKRIRIDREAGLIAERDDGAVIKLEALSSGEQHELVMHYDLLFRVKPNTLVLIDEPELSLHVAWQKRFLPDLLKIVATAQFDALIATHSPFIVGDRTDLMIGLNAELV